MVSAKHRRLARGLHDSDTRISAKAAEYMELAGAKKDGDCVKVAVDGGISLELGCCDKFKPKSASVKQFRCGECKFHRDEDDE